jgi:membrane-bound lytic murein transglycosylase
MQLRHFITSLLLLTSVVCAQQPPDLQAQAEAAQGKKRVELFVEVAEQRLDQASRLFNEGKNEEAHEAVKKSVAASQEASDTARKSRKRLKQTEISVRQMVRRLTDLSNTLEFDDREAIKPSVEKLEEIRRQLLEEMFGKKKEQS